MRKLLHVLVLLGAVVVLIGSCGKNYDIEDLREAALENDRPELKKMLESKDWPSEDLSLLLFDLDLSKFSQYETAMVLADFGADINFIHNGETVLSGDFRSYDRNDVSNLINRGADPTLGKSAPLPYYFYNRNTDWKVSEVLLEYTVDRDLVNARDAQRDLPYIFYAAAGANYHETIELLRNGADASAEWRDGITPLFFALRGLHGADIQDEKHYDVEKLISPLLVHGADIMHTDVNGNTAMMDFLLFKMEEKTLKDSEITRVLKYLLRHGCNPNVGNDEGLYPLEIALQNDLYSSAKTFIQYGANPFIRRTDGTTILSLASNPATLVNITGLGLKPLRTDDTDKVIEILFGEDGIARNADPSYGTVDTYSRNGLGRKHINDLIRTYYHVE